MADDSDVVWSFGIGSNMNVDIVENKKKIKVIDHACAVLTGKQRTCRNIVLTVPLHTTKLTDVSREVAIVLPVHVPRHTYNKAHRRVV